MCYRAVLLVISAVVLLDSLVFGEDPWFSDEPPSDFMERKNLRDCPNRFYRDLDPYGIPHFGYGGRRVFRGEYQHMVAIGWTRSNVSIEYLCGGTLITARHVLTAAHCTYDSENIAPDTVRIGDTDLGSLADDEFAQQFPILGITVHPKYRGSRKYFDVALIELAQRSKFSEAVCPACLWREEELPEERMQAIGFGVTGFGEARSPTLQLVKLDKVEPSVCAERIFLNRRQMPDGFRNDQFCASGNGMDTCEGDSGGPIGVKRLDVEGRVIHLVTGVVSFGTPCVPGSTGVYTRISDYIDWIEQETNRTLSYGACSKGFLCPGRATSGTTVYYDESRKLKHRFGLLWNEADPSIYECGATLIDYQFLVTSAHCVTTAKGYPKYVAHDDSERVAVTDVYVSPRYKPGSPDNDIALVKMAKFINPNVFRPVCLWDRRIDGAWSGTPRFAAYGPILDDLEPVTLTNSTISVHASIGKECRVSDASSSDLVCFNNSVKMIPDACWMDYGGAVTNKTELLEPVFMFGVTSVLSQGCGSNLIVTDVTPHIRWIEAIVVARRNQMLVFTD
ncbi:transmembrane protease serine 9-like [Anopheles darlingi]|uniref:transmembrane protease serine 9-like n=1 Tax=Anopheles darlingi TaxID=43151 RepID=UPI0021003EB4|nr:transmembrane protease serine 9-like [Anopheles darlingi]